MARVRISVSGHHELEAALEHAREAVESELAAAVESEAEAIVQDARLNVRRDSGDLADSIAAEVNGLTAEVRPRSSASAESGRDHAIKAAVNEFGRSGDPGQPYMTPAAEVARERWPRRVSEAVRRAVED